MNLLPSCLTAESFLPYGEVVSTASARAVFAVNDGRARRFAHLATQQSHPPALTQELSLYRVSPSNLPLVVSYFERHPLSSQLFYPLSPTRYLVVVCPAAADGQPDAGRAHAWLAGSGIGINYHAGVWHYPLVALDQGGDFLMLMAQSGGMQDCEIAQLAAPFSVGT
ncbi:MAG: ureidoglycolate lyase [Polaromonas sp.]